MFGRDWLYVRFKSEMSLSYFIGVKVLQPIRKEAKMYSIIFGDYKSRGILARDCVVWDICDTGLSWRRVTTSVDRYGNNNYNESHKLGLYLPLPGRSASSKIDTQAGTITFDVSDVDCAGSRTIGTHGFLPLKLPIFPFGFLTKFFTFFLFNTQCRIVFPSSSRRARKTRFRRVPGIRRALLKMAIKKHQTKVNTTLSETPTDSRPPSQIVSESR